MTDEGKSPVEEITAPEGATVGAPAIINPEGSPGDIRSAATPHTPATTSDSSPPSRRRSGFLLRPDPSNESLTANQRLQGLIDRWGFTSINLKEVSIDRQAIKELSEKVIRAYRVLPIAYAEPLENPGRPKNSSFQPAKRVVIAVCDWNPEIEDAIRFNLNRQIQVVVDSEENILWAINLVFGADLVKEDLKNFGHATKIVAPDEKSNANEEKAAGESALVVQFVENQLLPGAVTMRASDIHLEPEEKSFRVRYRIDGELRVMARHPIDLYRGVISRLKILAELKFDESRRPQDGHIRMLLDGGQQVEFRLSLVPGLWGEKAVLRVIDKNALRLRLENLGFSDAEKKLFRKIIHRPRGLVLITGPTGSGKTTTLAASLNELNDESRNISTVEDPVEIPIPGITQVQVKPEIGVTFANVLRSFLRQDPNVIMVGEIRDYETAEVAVDAALTGHLVLSTLHTNNAVSTVQRLTKMGVEPILLIDGLTLVCAQRLVRKICTECDREQVHYSIGRLLEIGFTVEEAAAVSLSRATGYRLVGQDKKTKQECPACRKTGYCGREAIYEMLVLDNVLREAILDGKFGDEFEKLAVSRGMMTLRRAGILKVISGVTTIDEVLRVTTLED